MISNCTSLTSCQWSGEVTRLFDISCALKGCLLLGLESDITAWIKTLEKRPRVFESKYESLLNHNYNIFTSVSLPPFSIKELSHALFVSSVTWLLVSTKITLNLEWGLFKEQINKILKFSAPLCVHYICPISCYFLMHIGWQHNVYEDNKRFSFFRAWNQEHSNIILYLLLHFLTLCCPFYQSNVSQEKKSCLKLIQCLIFMISLIIMTTKIHKKIGINPSLEQTLPLYLTLALMISFPAGRGCILSIFSHSCCNHRSTTASGLSQKKKKLDSLLSYHKCTCLIGCTDWCIF